MKNESYQSESSLTKMQVVFLFFLLLVFGGFLVQPLFLKKSKMANKALATNNAKEIGHALLGFIDEFGGYPSQETLEKLRASGVEVLPIGNDANSYLGQLLASEAVDSEAIFYFKNFEGFRKGDNDYSSPEKMLAQGENAFGYVMIRGEKPLLMPGSIVPVIVAPLIAGGSDPVFDKQPFAGQYIYLTPDGAVSGGKISKDGKPIAKGRGPGGLFGAGKDSVFGNDIPDVKMPR